MPAAETQGPTPSPSTSNFNALGTIFRTLTGADIHADFATRIGIPCGMEDFLPETDGAYVELDASIHPAYPFRMTARDLARFGELYLRRGRAAGRQIVPEHWIALSLLPYSDAAASGAYGYMWWIERAGMLFRGVIVPEGTFAAKGAGGHYVIVMPALDAVLVHRVDTNQPGREITAANFARLLRLVLAASPCRSDVARSARSGSQWTFAGDLGAARA